MQLIGVRERLLAQLDAVDTAGSSAAFQRSLADELRAAEADSSPDSPWHRHLLRLMGDALARKTLSEHVLFELAREMHPVPSLSAQGSDFDFVLDTAEAFARGGVPVVVSDLTHLVGVGDIVTVNGGNAISIIECKNRVMPDNLVLRGRHWRQQRRQADAAAYLSTGYLSSDGQRPRIALEVDQPQRRDGELLQCIEQAWRSPTGSATAYFGERDLLIACWNRGLPVEDVFSRIIINKDGWRSAVTAGSRSACANPGPFIANPYSLPLPAGYRHAIAEGALILLRCVDLQLLAGELEAGGARCSVEVYRKNGVHRLRAAIGGAQAELPQDFVNRVLWNYWAARDIRSMLAAFLDAAQRFTDTPEVDRVAAAAPEGPVLATFAYRNPDGSPEPVFVTRLEDLGRYGVSIPYSELEALAREDEPSEIHAVMERREDRLQMRLTSTGPDPQDLSPVCDGLAGGLAFTWPGSQPHDLRLSGHPRGRRGGAIAPT